MSNVFDRKTLNEAMPDLRESGGFFNYIGTYNFLNVTTLANIYSSRSGQKKISTLLDYYVDSTTGHIENASQQTIGLILKNIYEEKWGRISTALSQEYNLLREYEETETINKTIDNDVSRSSTNGATSESMQYGSQTNTFDKGTETIQNQYGSTSETTQFGAVSNSESLGAQSTTTSNYVNGFNNGNVADTSSTVAAGAQSNSTSTAAHSDTTSTLGHTDTIQTSSLQDTTVNGQHTDTKTTQAVTNSETIANDTTDTTSRQKYGHNSPVQDILQKEFEVRKFNFIEMMMKDIDEYLVLSCYC